MSETKRDKFLRILEMRLNKLNDDFRKIRTLANLGNYDFTKDDIDEMCDEINRMFTNLKEEFNISLDKVERRVNRQKLKDDNSSNDNNSNNQEKQESELNKHNRKTVVPGSVPKQEQKQETEERKVNRIKEELKEDDGCPSCGKPCDIIYECPKCSREGCDSCMPGGCNVDCPECESKKGAE